MNRIKTIYIFLALLFFIMQKANAQAIEEKKNVNSLQTNPEGIKQKTSSSERVANPTPSQNSIAETPNNLSDNKSEKNISSNNSEKKNLSIETIRWDYNHMPIEVQSKINENKLSEKKLLDGIVKGFLIEIKSCNSSETTNDNLSFLKGQNGIIREEFVSNGIVKIIVEPDFDSVDLKEKMLGAGIDFNFLNEFYLVNK